MNILFLTMARMTDIRSSGIYSDLMRKFRDNGHRVYVISPMERRFNTPTYFKEIDGAKILCVRTLNVQKTNVIEKGLGQILLDPLFKRAIGKYFRDVKFDLILYSTPPITFVNAIKFVHKQNPGALTYLMLKDIFPQNAVDLGMMTKSGVKGLLYKFFRNKEVALYNASDFIGCMSPANVHYVLKHNPWIDPKTIEVAPNSVELKPEEEPMSLDARKAVLDKYGIPSDKPIFIYGGNMGKPQGIPFLIECMDACKNRTDCHFLIVGGGTEFGKLDAWYKENKPASVTLLSSIPKNDYDQLVKACQVGLIFLDYRFTIPNYPSRLLPYLENKMPIIACTDPNCDMGAIAETNGYGYWCSSNDVKAFSAVLDKMVNDDIVRMGENGYDFFLRNYTVQQTYDVIVNHLR